VALYESSGFHYHHVDVCYSRQLRLHERISPEVSAGAGEVAAA
jgi:hypothetical protein